MNIWYRRLGSAKWERAILIGGGYWEESWFVLRWDPIFQDFEEVVVPTSRVRF